MISASGGAVSEEADLRGRYAGGNVPRDPVEHAERGILRRACDLLDLELAGRGIEQHQIGVGAADIDTEPIAGCVSSRRHGRACPHKVGHDAGRTIALMRSDCAFC